MTGTGTIALLMEVTMTALVTEMMAVPVSPVVTTVVVTVER